MERLQNFSVDNHKQACIPDNLLQPYYFSVLQQNTLQQQGALTYQAQMTGFILSRILKILYLCSGVCQPIPWHIIHYILYTTHTPYNPFVSHQMNFLCVVRAASYGKVSDAWAHHIQNPLMHHLLLVAQVSHLVCGNKWGSGGGKVWEGERG